MSDDFRDTIIYSVVSCGDKKRKIKKQSTETDKHFTTLQQAAGEHAKPGASSSMQHCRSSILLQLALQSVQTLSHAPAATTDILETDSGSSFSNSFSMYTH